MIQKQALFPLNTVLFPGSILPLQIFEQRYINMIKSCMRNQTGFVVVLIRAGKEVGDIPEIYGLGTYVEIIDWETLDNSLLGITTKGVRPARIIQTTANPDGLLTGDIDYIDAPDNNDIILADKYQDLVETLQQLCQHPFIKQIYSNVNYSSCVEISYRLSELLPVSNSIKQELLETLNVYQRLDKLQSIINKLST